jgi:L-iditol 2-dehydrogenase
MENRLALAKKMGADHTVLLSKDCDELQVVAEIHKLLGKEPDKSVDCSGAQLSVRVAIQV